MSSSEPPLKSRRTEPDSEAASAAVAKDSKGQGEEARLVDPGKAPVVHPFFTMRRGATAAAGATGTLFRGAVLPTGWQVLGEGSCLYRACGTVSLNCPRVLGIDFDDTLVKRHSDELAFPAVLERLCLAATSVEIPHRVVVFTNESLEHMTNFSNTLNKKLGRMETFAQKLGAPIEFFISTQHDEYRKPSSRDALKGKPGGGTKMWHHMASMCAPPGIDLSQSVYVGDAAGASGSSFAGDCDLCFAQAVGVQFFEARTFFAPVFGVPLWQPSSLTSSSQALGAAASQARNSSSALATDESPSTIPVYRHPQVKLKPLGPDFKSALAPYLGPEGCKLPLFWFATQSAVVIYDAWPKGRIHCLVIARFMPNEVRLLEPRHLANLLPVHRLARDIGVSVGLPVLIGYHAKPSVDHLHIHVVSRDLGNAKTDKHWNSFTDPNLFIPIDVVESSLSSGNPVRLKDISELAALEKRKR